MPILKPIVRFEDLSKNEYEDLFDQMHKLTKDINLKFKALLSKMYKSFKALSIDHEDIILTLTEDNVMILERHDELNEAKDMFDVFKVIHNYSSYFNYDLPELLVNIYGSSEDKASLEEYLQVFTSYCQKMPCAEEICGNEDSKSLQVIFKLNFDRQGLKPNVLRCIRSNIANCLKIPIYSLYLKSVKEGCVQLEFLIPPFLFGHIFPLSDKQKTTLHKEVKVSAIHCEEQNLFVVCIIITVMLRIVIH